MRLLTFVALDVAAVTIDLTIHALIDVAVFTFAVYVPIGAAVESLLNAIRSEQISEDVSIVGRADESSLFLLLSLREGFVAALDIFYDAVETVRRRATRGW